MNDDCLMLLQKLIVTLVLKEVWEEEKDSGEHLDQRAKYGHHRDAKDQEIGGETQDFRMVCTQGTEW